MELVTAASPWRAVVAALAVVLLLIPLVRLSPGIRSSHRARWYWLACAFGLGMLILLVTTGFRASSGGISGLALPFGHRTIDLTMTAERQVSPTETRVETLHLTPTGPCRTRAEIEVLAEVGLEPVGQLGGVLDHYPVLGARGGDPFWIVVVWNGSCYIPYYGGI